MPPFLGGRGGACFSFTPVAGSIYRPLSRSFFHQRVFTGEISSFALLDIQPTLLCACGVDSFIPHLPELEHLIGKPLNVFTFSIPQQTRKPVGELGGTPGGFAVEMKLRSRSTYSKFGRANPFRRDYFDYLTNEAKSELWPMLKTCLKLRPRLREGGPKSILLPV